MIAIEIKWPDGSKSNHQISAQEDGEIGKP